MTALGEVIARRRDNIAHRWLEQVRSDTHVSPTDLREGIREYLARLADLLRGGDPVGLAAWIDVAQPQLANREFDVAQLARELIALRQITTDVLLEEGYPPGGAEGQQLGTVIDAALVASIQFYVDVRNQLASERIGFLTHELRNPLGVVSLVAVYLQRPNLSEADRHRAIDALGRNCDRMRHLIDNALLTGRLRSRAVEAQPVETTLGKLTEDAIPIFQQHAQDKGLKFSTAFDPNTPIRIDPALTLSALQNLLDNAIKYTDAGEVRLAFEAQPGELVVHVSDTGKGLTSEEVRVIFEPYRRFGSDRSGTGLGLAIARSAIEAQGGTIHVESTPTQGAHFWFTLPQEHARPKRK